MTTLSAAPILVQFVVYTAPGSGGGTDPGGGTGVTWDDGEFMPTAPEPGSTIVDTTPSFVVAAIPASATNTRTYTVDVQYDTSNTFATATTLTGTFNAVDGGIILIPATALAGGSYFWRAQLKAADGTVLNAWTDPWAFTLNATVAATTLPITWTVDPAADRPIHVWHFDPPGPDIGDTVTIYGQGFPSSGTLAYGDTTIPLTGWAKVPAITDPDDPHKLTGDARAIDGDIVSCEHYEVTFTAPALDGPGAALTLEA